MGRGGRMGEQEGGGKGPVELYCSKSTGFIFLLGFDFFLLFFSFNTTQNFETSLNDKLGFWCLSLLYFSFALSSLVSGVVVKKLGAKMALFVGSLGYTEFVFANLYPVGWVLLPSSVVIGIGASLLWTAQGTYTSKSSVEQTLGVHMGMFFALYQMNQIFGNLFAALFLTRGFNTSGLFVVLGVVSAFASGMFLTLRSPPEDDPSTKHERIVSISEVIGVFKERVMQLLFCVIFLSGLNISIFSGSFTALIGDPVTIGYVMCVFGISDFIGSFANGWAAKVIGKRGVLGLGFVSLFVAYSLSTVASVDNISTQYPWTLYVSAILLGYGDAVLNTQLYALLGSLNPQHSEPAFAYFNTVQATAIGMAFLYSSVMPYAFVVLIATFVMCLSIVFLVVLDVFVRPIDHPHDPLVIVSPPEEATPYSQLIQ